MFAEKAKMPPESLLAPGSTTATRCLSEANFNKLKRFQYALERVVTGMHEYIRDPMTPILAKLHWLPIRASGIIQDRHDDVQDPPDNAAILPGGTDRG